MVEVLLDLFFIMAEDIQLKKWKNCLKKIKEINRF